VWPWNRRKALSVPTNSSGDVETFWEWYIKNETILLDYIDFILENDGNGFENLNSLSTALSQYQDGLVYEFGRLPDGRVDFVISADGIFDLFASVTKLIDAAPHSNLFKFTAFRQRMEQRGLVIYGKSFDVSDFFYECVYPEDRNQRIDIYVFVENPGVSDDELKQIGYLMLDATIGEYDMETLIGGVEILDRSVYEELDRKTLDKLPNELDEFVRGRSLQ
jgi:hypothetical protein